MGQSNRYRFDDLRKIGSQLLHKQGMAPDRASAFISLLLWFDAADAWSFGIESLPNWIDLIERGTIDPKTEGTIELELNGTAVLNGHNGLAPLILMRAARIAQEKARGVGVGIVRVINLGGDCPAAPMTADIAIGPAIGLAQGPGPSWTVAVPTIHSVPAIFSTELGTTGSQAPPWSIDNFPVWSVPFSDVGSRVISAYSVKAFESLDQFHERIENQLRTTARVAGEVRPSDWQTSRDRHLTIGVTLPENHAQKLRLRADRVGIAWPLPFEQHSRS